MFDQLELRITGPAKAFAAHFRWPWQNSGVLKDLKFSKIQKSQKSPAHPHCTPYEPAGSDMSLKMRNVTALKEENVAKYPGKYFS